MDDYSHRLANALVGNNEKEAALEITLTGPKLQFHTECVLAVCGAEADVTGELEQCAACLVQVGWVPHPAVGPPKCTCGQSPTWINHQYQNNIGNAQSSVMLILS